MLDIDALCASSPPLMRTAFEIANESVVCTIESNGNRVEMGDGLRWYDTRPMLDEREHSPEIIAWHQRDLAYAEAAEIITRTGDAPWLVCLHLKA